MVIGSRFLGLGDYKPEHIKGIGIKIFAAIATAITGRRITDPTSGFQALNREAIRVYASESYPEDFPDADVLIMLHKAGLKIAEVPVVMHPRTSGRSMHSGLKPLFYIYKMFLSILVTLLRKGGTGKESP